MITYKGDRFVKGKKFLLDEQVVTFKTISKKGYIFEGSENKNIVLEESVARSLKEVKICTKNH